MEKKLNLDIPRNIVEFETLIDKILPKKIFYRLLLRGKGLEFDGYRNFGQDEDADNIDWKASIRANTLLAKQYIEERDIKIMFIIDIGENMIFGSTEKLKCEYCAEMAASLGKIMVNSGDKIGFIFFNNKVTKTKMPEAGEKQFNIFVYEISNAENYGGYPDINEVLESVMQRLNPSISLVILISDFIKVNEESRKKFNELAHVYETMAIMIKDPLDKTLPEINKEIVIENPNTGERMIVNPKIAKKSYERNAAEQTALVKDIFQDSNIDFLELETDKPFQMELALFLKRRIERRMI